jgi:DNA-directed RNA polymerase specialized sigma24 family protein
MTERERLLDELRPVAVAIAYRMLGSVAEAEDVVQEALLRVHQAFDAGERIASPRAFVATVTARLAINELLRFRTRDGDETTVYLTRHPIRTTRVSVVHFAEPTRLDHWCAAEGHPEAIVAGFFLRDPYLAGARAPYRLVPTHFPCRSQPPSLRRCRGSTR